MSANAPEPHALYTPPRPKPLSALGGLLRTAFGGEGNLLSLLPAEAYTMKAGPLGWSRRGILILNAPELVRGVMTDPSGIYPKNDLMVGALAPLVGDSIFVSSGEVWRRQRRMIDPAFSSLRLGPAFAAMDQAAEAFEGQLAAHAESGAPLSLDMAMSHLTADIICRMMFSTSLQSQMARDVFEAFAVFERSVAHVELKRLIFDKPWSKIPQKQDVLDACARIREHLGAMVDAHGGAGSDIASAVRAARDGASGEGFTREELIDQLGVFFLAGHETTASVLAWVFFILSQQPGCVFRIRREISDVAGEGPISFDHVKRLDFVRNVFRETLRLYPPITFIPRVAAQAAQIGQHKVRKGAMLMIAPWTIHRHQLYWKNPDAFDPDRFSPEREHEIVPGTYLPFGQGARVCVGAAFAATEAVLIIARLARRFDFVAEAPEEVRPVARLTTRPATQIMCKVLARQA